eukprot:6824482-Lingulodinium_polyedra.AAC.1
MLIRADLLSRPSVTQRIAGAGLADVWPFIAGWLTHWPIGNGSLAELRVTVTSKAASVHRHSFADLARAQRCQATFSAA